PIRRIVEFRAREISGKGPGTGCNEHLAVGQQSRRVTPASVGELAGVRPSAAEWIVEFRAREASEKPSKPPVTSTLPFGSNVAMCQARRVVSVPVAVHVPLTGSYSSALLRG